VLGAARATPDVAAPAVAAAPAAAAAATPVPPTGGTGIASPGSASSPPLAMVVELVPRWEDVPRFVVAETSDSAGVSTVRLAREARRPFEPLPFPLLAVPLPEAGGAIGGAFVGSSTAPEAGLLGLTTLQCRQ
jgi:hypothetical protein